MHINELKGWEHVRGMVENQGVLHLVRFCFAIVPPLLYCLVHTLW